jgi:hypothetical protein
LRLLRSSSVTPNCAPSRRICWHRAQLRGGAVLAAAGQADAPGSNRRARPLRRLCGSRAQTSPHRPKGPRRRRGCNRREPAVPDAARGDRPRPALAPRRASRACYRLPSFARNAGRHAPGPGRMQAPERWSRAHLLTTTSKRRATGSAALAIAWLRHSEPCPSVRVAVRSCGVPPGATRGTDLLPAQTTRTSRCSLDTAEQPMRASSPRRRTKTSSRPATLMT